MDIPRYPDSRPLDLEDKPFLDGIFSGLQPRISEFTFANLFLFRTAHEYRLTMVGDAIVLLGKGYDGVPYFLPPLSGRIDDALSRLFDEGATLYGADEPFVERFLREKRVEVFEDRDNFDYLYLRSDLADLPGNRFHKKKNRISYFTGRQDFVIELFGEGHVKGSLELLDEWRRVHTEMESSSLIPEADATAEAVKLFLSLGLEGVVALVEGEVKGFTLGERLNNATSVCHFEKADPFLDGLYQLIDREFSRRLFTDLNYINREQDLGIMNMRETKLSYHPFELIKKFRAWRK